MDLTGLYRYVRTGMYVQVCIYVCTYMYVCMYMHVCTCMWTHVQVCTWMYVAVYVQVWKCTNTNCILYLVLHYTYTYATQIHLATYISLQTDRHIHSHTVHKAAIFGARVSHQSPESYNVNLYISEMAFLRSSWDVSNGVTAHLGLSPPLSLYIYIDICGMTCTGSESESRNCGWCDMAPS